MLKMKACCGVVLQNNDILSLNHHYFPINSYHLTYFVDLSCAIFIEPSIVMPRFILSGNCQLSFICKNDRFFSHLQQFTLIYTELSFTVLLHSHSVSYSPSSALCCKP